MNDIPCIHFKKCSGCQLQFGVENPPILQRALAFFTKHGVAEFKCITGPPTAWRCRSKLAVRGSVERPLIGLFKEHSHEVIEIPQCLVHHPAINQAIQRIKEELIIHQVIPYDDNKGELRYLQCVVERSSQKMQLSFIVNSDSWTSAAVNKIHQVIKALVEQSPQLWHSIWINLNQSVANRIFGENWKLFHGEQFLWERIYSTSVCFLPASFGQANLDLFERMVRQVKEVVPSNAQVVEYYAGVGAIGLALADKTKWVKCIEINPQAEICFNESRQKLLPEIAVKLSYCVCSASDEEAMMSLLQATTVIVDPPRKGLDKELLEHLKSTQNVKMIVYISCGWDGFERDAKVLLQAGWKIQQASAYLFFPGADHLETLTVFVR